MEPNCNVNDETNLARTFRKKNTKNSMKNKGANYNLY